MSIYGDRESKWKAAPTGKRIWSALLAVACLGFAAATGSVAFEQHSDSYTGYTFIFTAFAITAGLIAAGRIKTEPA